MRKPKYLYRSSDGFRFTLRDDGRYSMDDTMMVPAYSWPIEVLKFPDFVENFEQCKFEKYYGPHNSHGDDEGC